VLLSGPYGAASIQSNPPAPFPRREGGGVRVLSPAGTPSPTETNAPPFPPREGGPGGLGSVKGAAVEARVWCQGSYLKRCARLECMAALTPEHLWPVLHEVLRTWESNRRSA